MRAPIIPGSDSFRQNTGLTCLDWDVAQLNGKNRQKPYDVGRSLGAEECRGTKTADAMKQPDCKTKGRL